MVPILFALAMGAVDEAAMQIHLQANRLVERGQYAEAEAAYRNAISRFENAGNPVRTA